MKSETCQGSETGYRYMSHFKSIFNFFFKGDLIFSILLCILSVDAAAELSILLQPDLFIFKPQGHATRTFNSVQNFIFRCFVFCFRCISLNLDELIFNVRADQKNPITCLEHV